MMIPRTLFSSDHETFRDTVRKFLENEAVPFNEEWEQQGVVPKEVWLKAGEQGFLCPMVSEEYGGIGADFLYSVVISEEIAKLGLTGIG
ncbi:acyl-CoA dehydrogenase family protein, partial [Alcanivorax sp. HI0083]|uniref:acyl-CoA dehydrogenase family protein n=1 Tax=Alcanivorax sp. HI0083 TaxID=1822258 RepID=UPI001E4337E3